MKGTSFLLNLPRQNGTFVHDHKEWRIERMATFMQGSREKDTFRHRIFALKTNRTRVPLNEDGISLPESKYMKNDQLYLVLGT